MEFTKTPYVKFKKINDYVEGTLLKIRSQDSQFKNSDGSNRSQEVYDVAVSDLTATTLLSGKEVDINEGDTVTVFGSKQINEKMADKNPGDLVRITFGGKVQKRGKRKGSTFEESQYEVR